MTTDELDLVTARALIAQIAEVSATVGFHAGVGAMELAGQIVSCLYASPHQVERFMAEGSELFIDGTFDPANGLLSYMAISGKVTSPSELRKGKGLSQ